MKTATYLLSFRGATKLATVASFFSIAMMLSTFGQTTVQVDSTKPWLGYMNVYNISGGAQGSFVFGQPWGTAALTAFFTGTTTATMMPNTNTWNANDAFWVNNGNGN